MAFKHAKCMFEGNISANVRLQADVHNPMCPILQELLLEECRIIPFVHYSAVTGLRPAYCYQYIRKKGTSFSTCLTKSLTHDGHFTPNKKLFNEASHPEYFSTRNCPTSHCGVAEMFFTTLNERYSS